MSQLLRATVSIDESNLHSYLRQVVDTATVQLRGEMNSIQRQVNSLSQTVIKISEEFNELKENGFKDPTAPDEEEVKEQELQAHRDEVSSMITSAMERRMNTVSGSLRKLEDQLTVVRSHQEENQFTTVNELNSLKSEQKLQQQSHENLLEHLGVAVNEQVGGLVRSGPLEDAPFMSEYKVAMTEHSKRISAVESSLRNKIEKSELDAIQFSLSDVKGFAAAAVSSLISHERKMENLVRDTARDLRNENSGKVSWTDLDSWKASMAETATNTRKASVEALSGVERLEKEFATLKISLSRSADASEATPSRIPPSRGEEAEGSRSSRRASRTTSPSQFSAAAEQEGSRANTSSSGSAVKRRLSGTDRFAEYAEVAPSPVTIRRPKSAQLRRPLD